MKKKHSRHSNNHQANLLREFAPEVADNADHATLVPDGLAEAVGMKGPIYLVASLIYRMSAGDDILPTNARLRAILGLTDVRISQILKEIKDAGYIRRVRVMRSGKTIVDFIVPLRSQDKPICAKDLYLNLEKHPLDPEWKAKVEFTRLHVKAIQAREAAEKSGEMAPRQAWGNWYEQALQAYRERLGNPRRELTVSVMAGLMQAYERGADMYATANSLAANKKIAAQKILSAAAREIADEKQLENMAEFDKKVVSEALSKISIGNSPGSLDDGGNGRRRLAEFAAKVTAVSRPHGGGTRVTLSHEVDGPIGVMDGNGSGLFGKDKLYADVAVKAALSRRLRQSRGLPEK